MSGVIVYVTGAEWGRGERTTSMKDSCERKSFWKRKIMLFCALARGGEEGLAVY